MCEPKTSAKSTKPIWLKLSQILSNTGQPQPFKQTLDPFKQTMYQRCST